MHYPRIELQPDSFLEELFGWRVLEQGAALKLLEKRVGPARKLMLLLDRAPSDLVDEIVEKHGLVRPMTLLTVCDFGWTEQDKEFCAGGRTLSVVEPRRMRFAPTFVFDLFEPEDVLFSRVASRERSKIRKSERQGMRVEVVERPTVDDLSQFVDLYAPMARRRGLEPIRVSWLKRGFERGHMVLTRAIDSGGKPVTIYILYALPSHGYYLHAAHDPAVVDAGGHLLFWKSLQHLKARGVRWFDFGMVGTTDPGDGIYRFKKCFGGAFVTPGREWERRPSWMAAAAFVARRGRTVLHRAAQAWERR
jgi:hypothetical protein